MPRIQMIAPPMAFQDRSTELVNPIMANAMQLAETFTTEIPRIRMQQDAVAEERSRYGAEQQRVREDRTVAKRKRDLEPYALRAQAGLLTDADMPQMSMLDPAMGKAYMDVSGKVQTTEQDKDFDTRFGSIFPKVTGDPLASRGTRSTVRDDLAREKAANAPYAVREKERSDARKSLAGERFDHDGDPTTPSILMSPADVNKRVDELFPAMPRVDPNDPGTTGESPLGEYGPATDGGDPPLTMGGGVAYNEAEKAQMLAMISHSAAVRKLGQPAIDRIKALIDAGATPAEAVTQTNTEAGAQVTDTPTDFSLGYEEGGPRLGQMQDVAPAPVAAPTPAPVAAPVAPATAPVGPALTRLAGSLTSLGRRDAALSESQSGRMAPGPGDRMLMASGGDSLVALRGVEKDIGALAQTDPEAAQILRDAVEQYRQAILAANEDPAAELTGDEGAVGPVRAGVEMASRQRALPEARTRLAQALAALGL